MPPGPFTIVNDVTPYQKLKNPKSFLISRRRQRIQQILIDLLHGLGLHILDAVAESAVHRRRNLHLPDHHLELGRSSENSTALPCHRIEVFGVPAGHHRDAEDRLLPCGETDILTLGHIGDQHAAVCLEPRLVAEGPCTGAFLAAPCIDGQGIPVATHIEIDHHGIGTRPLFAEQLGTGVPILLAIGDNEVDEDLLDTPRDIKFYKNNANAREGVIEMQVGSYAMFFPWDVHIPAIQVGEPAYIRKIVLKVALDTCL